MGAVFRGLKRKLISDDSEEENENEFRKKWPRIDRIFYPEVSLKQQKAYLQYLRSRFGQKSQRHSLKKDGNNEMDLSVKYCEVEYELPVSQGCEESDMDIIDRMYPPKLQDIDGGNDVKELRISDFEVKCYKQFELCINDKHSVGSSPCELDDLKGGISSNTRCSTDKSNEHENNVDKNFAISDFEVQGYKEFAHGVVGRHSTGYSFLPLGEVKLDEPMQREDWLCFVDNFNEYFDDCLRPRALKSAI